MKSHMFYLVAPDGSVVKFSVDDTTAVGYANARQRVQRAAHDYGLNTTLYMGLYEDHTEPADVS